MISVGVDFGGSGSKTVFVASGFIGKFERLAVLADHKLEGGKGAVDVDRICGELSDFVLSLHKNFPAVPIIGVYCDNEAQAVINSIRAYFFKKKIPVKILDCRKCAIIDRIAALSVLMAQRRLVIHADCKNVIGSLQTQVWDEKKTAKLIRLDDGTKDIDTADAFEYSFSAFIEAFNLQIRLAEENE